MAKRFTLGKKERLKSRKSIERLFSEGRKFISGSFRVSHLPAQLPHPGIQFGIGVGNKQFKKAVDRNRIKRLCREAWRLQKSSLQEKLVASKKGVIVFFIYTGKEIPEYTDLFQHMGMAVSKLEKLYLE
ncbi:MAG TPA: ribonuclease P protein component [Chitinophagaceae bacterium]|nr:ribonuclease P protein component [Chitinophagaceae bacterium]